MILINKGVHILCLCIMLVVKATIALESTSVSGDLHSSPEDLEAVFAFDKIVGDAVKYLSSPSESAKLYLQSFGWLLVDTMDHGEYNIMHPTILGHPLHVYTLIKRLVLFYPDIRDAFNSFQPLKEGRVCENHHIKCDLWSSQGRCASEREFMTTNCPASCGFCAILEKIQAVKEAENRTVLPSSMDLTGAAEAIGYLRHIYNLPMSELLRGQIYNTFCSVKLNEWDCVRIARACGKQEMLTSAWLWYHYIRITTTNPEMAAYANELIGNIAIVHDETWKDTEDYFKKPLSEFPIQNQRASVYTRLCRGDELRSDEDLRCELSSGGNPFLLLQPLKRETILNDPEIYIFYDVISETEMETLKQLSQGKLIRDIGQKRISQMTFLTNVSHPVLESINRRASLLTGLLADEGTESSVAAEPLKIRSYGTGGHLKCHADVYYKHRKNNKVHPETEVYGDRMATLVFYLNDVTAGGRTAFQNLKLSLTPVKGAAVFWYNLKKNGDYDHRMSHGGCPVVLGNKWLALKWIRERWNFQTRPCTTVQDE